MIYYICLRWKSGPRKRGEKQNERVSIMGKTSTQSKRKYNDKTYTRVYADLEKDMVERFKEKCNAESIPQAKIIKSAVEKFLDPLNNDLIRRQDLIEEIRDLRISIGGKDVFSAEVKESILRIIDGQTSI